MKQTSHTESQKTGLQSPSLGESFLAARDDIAREIGDPETGDLSEKTPRSVVEAVAVLIYTAQEARRRITKEGSVVRDMKGAVVPHPAIAIEAAAIKQYTDLIMKNARRGAHR